MLRCCTTPSQTSTSFICMRAACCHSSSPTAANGLSALERTICWMPGEHRTELVSSRWVDGMEWDVCIHLYSPLSWGRAAVWNKLLVSSIMPTKNIYELCDFRIAAIGAGSVYVTTHIRHVEDINCWVDVVNRVIHLCAVSLYLPLYLYLSVCGPVEGVIFCTLQRHLNGWQVHRDGFRRQEGNAVRSDILNSSPQLSLTCTVA